jgi:hypothetical protein
MGAGSGPPYGAHVVHHGANKLLIQQHSIPDEEFTPSVQEGTQQADPLGSSPANLADVVRLGASFVEGRGRGPRPAARGCAQGD